MKRRWSNEFDPTILFAAFWPLDQAGNAGISRQEIDFPAPDG
jgi:hypothetical protein